MMWAKKGLLFRPDGARPWMRTHAQNACALDRGDGTARVFFATRDDRSRSHVGWIDVDLTNEPVVTNVAEEPLLAPGPLGHFDDHGCYPSTVLRVGEETWLYYIGWNPGKRDPLFYTSIGLAISRDDGRTYIRHSVAPIVSRGEHDPWMASACRVLLDDGLFRMWYISGIGWDERADGTLWSRYHIKYAESENGIDWRRDGRVAFDLEGDETNIARPSIVKDDDVYCAWFPVYSGEGYRIRYAESHDGLTWSRKNEENPLEPTPGSFDSDAVAYPWVFRGAGRLWMLYNGNALGRDGIAIAERVSGGN
jgi:hypothetical protein